MYHDEQVVFPAPKKTESADGFLLFSEPLTCWKFLFLVASHNATEEIKHI
jgi:hypothetical protein